MKLLFGFLIFPGFLFSACAGLIAGWVDRKVSARIQWRVGPPWYQNFVDILKLLGKEVVIPRSSRRAFLLAPYLGLLSLAMAATILGRALLAPQEGFLGDVVVLLYLLAVPAIAMIIGASSSANPLASVGASREMKLLMAYELPFILALITAIAKSGGVLQVGGILVHQQQNGSHALSLSGGLAFLAALIASHAKIGMVPFDASEAEQEIMGGTLIEYSGLPLALFKINKALLLYVMPVFLIAVFLGADTRPALVVAKFVAILVVFILIKNTNPRLRIDQSVRFFWGPVTCLALLGLALAFMGL